MSVMPFYLAIFKTLTNYTQVSLMLHLGGTVQLGITMVVSNGQHLYELWERNNSYIP